MTSRKEDRFIGFRVYELKLFHPGWCLDFLETPAY